MGLLKKAVNEQAYLKAGLLGFPGSGKTYTASMLAIALAKGMGGNKPVAFVDTETGSDFMVRLFEAENVELLRVKSQAFKDLLTAGREAEGACSVLIVDSISHIWRELCEAYQKRRNLSRLSFQHWGDIKREWSEWTKFYLNSKLHIFVLGRAGYEYDMEDAGDGKKELIKVGTKMKVESEFGFEPSLLIEMERVAKSAEAGAGWTHRAHILKDRTDTVNGKAFDFQKPRATYKTGDWKGSFKPFEPIFKAMNIGGEHHGIDSDRNSEELFCGPSGEPNRAMQEKRKEIALEEIKHSLIVMSPGTSDASKQVKATILEEIFGVRVWSAVEIKPLEMLEGAIEVLRRLEKTLPSAQPETPEDLRKFVKHTIDSGKPEPDDINI